MSNNKVQLDKLNTVLKNENAEIDWLWYSQRNT